MSAAARPSITKPSIVRRAAIARGHDPESLARRFENARRIAREQQQMAADFDEQPTRDFAHHVAIATAGPCLRYSQRLQLLDLAQRDGISRFDANLIIAAIEHHSVSHRKPVEKSVASTATSSRALMLTTALAVQLAIVLVGWIALH